MSTTWKPEVGEITVPETIVEKTIKGVLNRPPEGARIRATLGQTVIVGSVTKGGLYHQTSHPVIYVDIKPLKGNYAGLLSAHTLWIEDGWKFEILDAPEEEHLIGLGDDAPSIEDLEDAYSDARELVSA